MAVPPKPIDDMRQEGEKLRPIMIIHRNVLSGIATTRHMVDGTGIFNS